MYGKTARHLPPPVRHFVTRTHGQGGFVNLDLAEEIKSILGDISAGNPVQASHGNLAAAARAGVGDPHVCHVMGRDERVKRDICIHIAGILLA